MRFRHALIALAAMPAIASAATPVTGSWKTQDGKAVVTIAPCGNAMCGHVTKILKATPDGPPTDRNNPDPKLRDRPIKGLEVLIHYTDEGDEWHGHIYDPEKGKTYRSVMKRKNANTLTVKGCIAFFCKTQEWTRAG